jgi:hypothetical protein
MLKSKGFYFCRERFRKINSWYAEKKIRCQCHQFIYREGSLEITNNDFAIPTTTAKEEEHLLVLSIYR